MWGWAQLLALGSCSPLKLLEISCGSRMKERHGGCCLEIWSNVPLKISERDSSWQPRTQRAKWGLPPWNPFCCVKGQLVPPEQREHERWKDLPTAKFIPGAVSQEVTKVKSPSFKFALGSNPRCLTYQLCGPGLVAPLSIPQLPHLCREGEHGIPGMTVTSRFSRQAPLLWLGLGTGAPHTDFRI